MNAYEQLDDIKHRLELNGANEATIDLVEKFLKRAEFERNSNTSITQVMMIRHLLRQREAYDNHAIYDDLQELLSEHENRRISDDAVRPAYEDTSHQPRPKSFYKAMREKDKDKR